MKLKRIFILLLVDPDGLDDGDQHDLGACAERVERCQHANVVACVERDRHVDFLGNRDQRGESTRDNRLVKVVPLCQPD